MSWKFRREILRGRQENAETSLEHFHYVTKIQVWRGPNYELWHVNTTNVMASTPQSVQRCEILELLEEHKRHEDCLRNAENSWYYLNNCDKKNRH
jgi:hypothetical protein